LRSL
jgi:Protein of unknown function (DUF2874).